MTPSISAWPPTSSSPCGAPGGVFCGTWLAAFITGSAARERAYAVAWL